jgi:hypothetical protein
MSDELSMAQKLELVRTATAKGFSAGDAGEVNLAPPPRMAEFEPYSMSTDIQEGNRVEPPGFHDDDASSETAVQQDCFSLGLYTETVGSTVKLMVGAGQIGTQYFAGKDLGALSSKHGHIVYIQTDLNGTTGTYTSDVKTAATFPTDGSPTKSYFSIGSISAAGDITQQMCGNFVVNVCRNWFAATAPFYNMSITGISRSYFNV